MIRQLTRCTRWCTAVHTPESLELMGARICTHRWPVGPVLVELAAVDRGEVTVSIGMGQDRWIEDLSAAEAEALARALLDAAAAARGRS